MHVEYSFNTGEGVSRLQTANASTR